MAALKASGLVVPGSQSVMASISLLFSGSFSMACLMEALVGRPLKWVESSLGRPLLLFVLIILCTGAVRGFGMRILGAATWGGGAYVELTAASMALFLARQAVLTERQWKATFCLLCLFPLIRFVIGWSAGHGVPGFTAVQLLLYGATPSSLAASFDVAGKEVRYIDLGSPALYLFLLALYWRQQSRFVGAAAMILSVSMAMLTGYRSLTISLGIIGVAYWMVRPNRQQRFGAGVAWMFAVIGVWALLTVVMPHLPFAAQRSLAFLPGLSVDEAAWTSSTSTTTWRIEMWKILWQDEVPRYLWLGKGFAFRMEDLLGFIHKHGYETMILSRNYHNGPLSMLIDLGVMGLVVGSWLFWRLARFSWRRCFTVWNSPTLRALHNILTAMLVSRIVVFYLVVGDMRSTGVEILFLSAMIVGLAASDERLSELKATASSNASEV
jgi:hypothetical protein